MKKYFLHWAVLLTAGLSMAFAACSDSDKDTDSTGTPIFPTPVTATIVAGAQYSFDIEPNMAWEAKIPTEVAEHFWFVDGSQKTYTLRGTAGKTTLTVGCSALEQFDQDRVCEVSLTMGGQTQVIATIAYASLERTISICTAIQNPDSEEEGSLFVRDPETGDYSYGTEPVKSIAMLSLSKEYNYMQRIVVETNFDWAISKNPEWMEMNASSGSAGKTELFLRTDVEKCPWENVVEQIVFIDNTDSTNPVEVASYEVSMTGCADILYTNLAAAEQFNAAGAYYTASQGSYGSPEIGTYKTFELTYGSEVFLVVEHADGNLTLGNAGSWIYFADEFKWSESAKTAGLWSQRLQILCKPNTGDARKAYLIAIPKAKVPQGFDRQSVIAGQQIASAYSAYVASTFTQAAALGDFSIKVETSTESDQYFKFSQLPAGDYPFEGAWSAASIAYHLTYETPFAYEMAAMEFSRPYASYEIYGEEGPYATAPMASPWLTLEESPWEAGKMWIKLKGKYDYKNMKFTWEGTAPEVPMAYFVFKDEDGQILGIVEFMFIEKEQGGGTDKIALAQETPGVTLAPIASDDPDFEADFVELNVPQYKLTITSTSVGQISLILPEHDETTFYDDEKIALYAMGSTYVLMPFFETAGDKTEITLKKQDMIIGYIVVEYKPE